MTRSETLKPDAARPGAPRALSGALGGLGPAFIVAAFLIVYLSFVLQRGGGDPLVFARVGDGFRGGVPAGELGYDGQFAYAIALDPRPEAAAAGLDVPAYRYQRILFPLLARGLALGQAELIPWTLIALGAAAHVAGTALVERLLAAHGASRWYALVYGLWAGLILAVRLDLNEPLCYALLAGGWLAHQRGRLWQSAAWLSLALLAKETALLFVAAQLAWSLFASPAAGWRRFLPPLASLVPFVVLQFLLYRWFGAIGLTSGGYLATGFEWIPFMGLWRIGQVSPSLLLLFSVILGPLVVLPALWGIGAAAGRLLHRDFDLPVWALVFHAGFLPFTPHSTFREPLGVIRLAVGLVLATIVFGAHTRSRRVLNYALAWIAALVFLQE